MSDVAQVIDGVEQPKNVALLDEKPALALDIMKQSGANTVAVAEGVVAAVEKLKPELPSGITLSIIKDDSRFIRESIEDVNTTMIIGGLLTVLIVYLFLNSWRSTIITGITLPISVVSGFIAMRAFGFTLNMLTLMGLSLAIGMLIDDAIVVRENIVRHLQRGKDHFQAARDGTAEIGLAVMATTFTILAVFVPVAFMAGMVGRIFFEFGITVAAAVAASLFVSFTLDPMLSSRWFDPDIERGYHPHFVGRMLKRFNDWFEGMHRAYERMLGRALRHRLLTIGVAAAAFVASFPILAVLGADFMPDYDRGEYQVMFKATPGATLTETRDRALQVVRLLKQMPEVDFTYTTIGEAGIVRNPVTEGQIYVRLKHGHGMGFNETLARARKVVTRVPGLTFRLHRGGPVRPEAAADQRARARDRGAGPHLAGADDGDGQDPRDRGPRNQPREEQARAARRVRSRPRRRPGPQRRTGGDDAARSADRRSRDHDRGRGRRHARRQGAPAAPTSAASPTICWRCVCRPTRTTRAATRSWCRWVRSRRRSRRAGRRRFAGRTCSARCASRRRTTGAAWARSRRTSRGPRRP